MANLSDPNDSLVLSYLGLRKLIGAIGIALPFVLAIGKIILDGHGIQSSISAYYYSIMRDVFVGSLCAIGVFLATYRGYEKKDSIASRLATFFAVGTALLPAAPAMGATAQQLFIDKFHLLLATCLFLDFAFFAVVLFRKSKPGQIPTPQKLKRNAVYTVCGYGILVCIALAFSLNFLPTDSDIFRFSPLFWLEASAIVLFGFSWFVKGEAILKD